MVSIIFPSFNITIIPPARPTTKAAVRMSRAPSKKCFTITLAPKPNAIPAISHNKE